ncbi:MAG: hypothetical protein R3E10_14425 [Gemmatimonadota bacterium]
MNAAHRVVARFALIPALLTGACSHDPEAPPEALALSEDIEVVETIAHRVEILEDTLGLTSPVHIRSTPGGYLVTDPRVSELVDITPDLRVRARLTQRGQGPGEAQSPYLLSRSGPWIGVYDLEAARILVFGAESREYHGVINLLTGDGGLHDVALLSDRAALLLMPDSAALLTEVEGMRVRRFGHLPSDLDSLRSADGAALEMLDLLGVADSRVLVFEPRSGTVLTYSLDSGDLLERASLPERLWHPLVEELDLRTADLPWETTASRSLAKDAEAQDEASVLLLTRGPDFFGLWVDLEQRTVRKLVSRDPTTAALLASANSATLKGDTLTAITDFEIVQVRLALN